MLAMATLTIATALISCNKEVPVTGVTIDEEILSIRVGSALKPTVSVVPVDATNKEVSYASTHTDIASVATDGTVTGVAIGETWIIVTTQEGSFKDSCQITVEPAAGSTITIAGNLEENITLKSDVNYILDGWVYVKNGITLSIEPGTVIKGKTGTKASLIIERGGKIMADGTAQKPIVFTSDKEPGARAAGDWGGFRSYRFRIAGGLPGDTGSFS